jgi:hypothetical protein
VNLTGPGKTSTSCGAAWRLSEKDKTWKKMARQFWKSSPRLRLFRLKLMQLKLLPTRPRIQSTTDGKLGTEGDRTKSSTELSKKEKLNMML